MNLKFLDEELRKFMKYLKYRRLKYLYGNEEQVSCNSIVKDLRRLLDEKEDEYSKI